MNERAALSRSESQALELLPWYVNGTLAAPEREQVRRELRSSLTCRLEYARLCRMQDLMQQDDPEQAATDRGLERLMARIHGSPPARRGLVMTRLLPARWRPVALAAALLGFAFGLAWWWSPERASGPAAYTTLTASEPAAEAPRLRLVFANGVPDETRREILAELGLTLAAPPTADGLYTLALPENADAEGIAARLRADPRIAFVTTPPAREGP